MDVFSAGLMNIGQQRHFYRANSLTASDVTFVKELFVDGLPPSVASVYQSILNMFSLVEYIENLPPGSDLDALKANYAINLEEEIQCEIESHGLSCLDLLSNGDASFFETEEGAAHFLSFICMQYLRTKKQQERIVTEVSGPEKDRIIKCINLIRVIFSIRLSSNLYCLRENYKLVLVDNVSEIDFLTSDQPVLNIFAVDLQPGQNADKFALYYPITPRCAVFFAEKGLFNSLDYLQFDANTVREHNDLMVRESHEQVYSRTESLLQEYAIRDPA